jgi:hypothetical protein
MDNGKLGSGSDGCGPSQQHEISMRSDRINDAMHSARVLGERINEIADRLFGPLPETSTKEVAGDPPDREGHLGEMDSQLGMLRMTIDQAHGQLNRIQSL